MSTFTKLVDEPVQFLLSFYGCGLALGFKGSADAVERCFNWASNCGVSKGQLWHLYDRGNSMAYVFVQNRDVLLAGLIKQIRAELIMSHEIPPLVDRINPETDEIELEYDEALLDQIATIRATDFLTNHITLDNFAGRIPIEAAPIYGLGQVSVGDASD